FNLFGLIPPYTADLSNQLNRNYEALQKEHNNLAKYIFLRALQDRNETLFYKLLTTHLTEMLPIVYTPTVGEGCQRFSQIYRKPRGIFMAYPYRDYIDEILSNERFDDVQVIVVSDGERILGLGDQGAGGMGIPIGKLSLYTACAGIHPATTLPIILDVGTNNINLINDPLYIGWKHERIRGKEYDDFIDLFVKAVQKRFPHILLHWEDFAQQNATPILERYRNKLCTFNDDIQGTAAVATGTLICAVQVTNQQLIDQKVIIVGAGSAGCGIANLMLQAMIEEGLNEEAARGRFYLIDRNGLLMEDMQDLLPFQLKFAQSRAAVKKWQCDNPANISLKEVITQVHPTVLVGVSGQPGIFTEEIIREMAKYVERPIIFPLSNPTERSEATPIDLMLWTNGQVIMGTGSPFDAVVRDGQLFRVDQTNNAYIFPGVGLGVIATKAKLITDKMFMVAAKALANCSPAKTNPKANLLPPLSQIRDVSFQVALAVAKEVVAAGLTEHHSEKDLEKLITENMWVPEYLPYKKAKK
ncbi:MAG: NAD-dependent malic enzyme, partial [Gammaproteobacteria bacterium]|nr:NAD-dependent malic enzyme [Gammaproteobacteria bacterium]